MEPQSAVLAETVRSSKEAIGEQKYESGAD
jgi:hypothetical protein